MYGGFLENMFAGGGGGGLYRPLGKNWGLGFDANLISQRDPDSWFAPFDETVVYYDCYDTPKCKPIGRGHVWTPVTQGEKKKKI